jgi:hypothetical protein
MTNFIAGNLGIIFIAVILQFVQYYQFNYSMLVFSVVSMYVIYE